ncbi:MAG: helix-turn-helix transcriptional regulator [Clostridia bacterium]|nr:helix-turn-helix transcriptional regulator [Clostridia bacterium]
MDQNTEKRIGRNIRAVRERLGLTQEYVAAQLQLRGCDITRSAVAKIEVGQRHLYPDELIHLREIFGVDYGELLDTQ